MLKIRMQGTRKDIRWFRRLLEGSREINIIRISETYANKGTGKYFRVYVEVERGPVDNE